MDVSPSRLGKESFRYIVGAVKAGTASRETSLHVTAMPNSDHLRKKRGLIRSGVTRALTLLTNLLQQPDSDASHISGHIVYLKDKEAVLSMLNNIILVTTNEDILDQEVGTVPEYSETILFVVSRAQFWLRERERTARTQDQATETRPGHLGSVNSADAAGQVKEHHQRLVKLW
ncbi:hypothetical protein HPB51_002912 [Rhipicephalus microplus]|uniref:Uncharacterized protein n=1 Tax=Rhipicephalus microplus TaxID=6941 RepID=A0A9J6DT40_RHIMP|nr:hypothetical protein HPB51_002912 [Rhipicephalus microplus]